MNTCIIIITCLYIFTLSKDGLYVLVYINHSNHEQIKKCPEISDKIDLTSVVGMQQNAFIIIL